MSYDNEKSQVRASAIDKQFPNIGFPGILVAIFVSSFFAAQILCDITVLLLYGWQRFFDEGLRVADWKHSVLSDGERLPWWGTLMIGPPIVPLIFLLILAAEFAAGHVRGFLASRSRWATAGARIVGAAALLGFSFWLLSASQGFPFMHPIPLSASIGGGVLLWKAVITPFRRPAS